MDGSLIINELFAWVKHYKKEAMMFKLNFEKTIDSLNWEFLNSTKMQMSFLVTWRR